MQIQDHAGDAGPRGEFGGVDRLGVGRCWPTRSSGSAAAGSAANSVAVLFEQRRGDLPAPRPAARGRAPAARPSECATRNPCPPRRGSARRTPGRLRRRSGSFSSTSACCGMFERGRSAQHSSRLGRVEGQHAGVQERPLPPGVEAAAILVRRPGRRRRFARGNSGSPSSRRVGTASRSARRLSGTSKPGDRQRVVAHQLGVEAEAALAGQQAVVGVAGQQLRRGASRPGGRCGW